MVYFGCHLVNPHVQTAQNMYGKGGVRSLQGRVTAAQSWPLFQVRKKNSLGGVTKTWQDAILSLEPNPLERMVNILNPTCI